MSRKDALREGAGLEQGEAEQHRVPENPPDGPDNVIRNRYALNHHRIDADADHNEETLKSQGKEGPQIILTHHALLTVPEGGKRNRCQAGHQVDFNHAAVDNHEDYDAQSLDGQLDYQAIQEKSCEGANFHALQCVLQGFKGGGIDCRVACNKPACVIDDVLCHVKDGYHNVEGIGDQNDGDEGLEDPFEENPGFEVGKVVVFNDHLNQLIAGDKCQNQTCNRDNHGFGNSPDHGEDPRREVRRGRSHLRCNIADLRVYRIKQSRQLVHDGGNKDFLEPFPNLIEYAVQRSTLLP